MAETVIDRRAFLAGAVGLCMGCAFDRGAPYDDYFRNLNADLRATAPGTPILAIDLNRLDHNLDLLRAAVGPRKIYRIVVKSLPSIDLLRYAMRHTQTRHLMAFHQPSLNAIANELPGSDVLLGKPLPASAARTFYEKCGAQTTFEPERQIQWLLDSATRAEEYRAVATALGVRMRVAIELDIGDHRGHVQTHDQLRAILRRIESSPSCFELGGFMGYDAYAAGLPPGLRTRILRDSTDRYQGFIDVTRREFPALYRPNLTRNGAGSKTIALYENDKVLNDLAAGSAAVMPTDFDVDTLSDHLPAAFIAAPILKHRKGVDIPILPILGSWMEFTNPNRRNSYFLYGGNWKANYHSPKGLFPNPIYGRSSNSEMVNGSDRVSLTTDDYVFLRPTQSESVLLQFGDLWAFRQGTPTLRWPVIRG